MLTPIWKVVFTWI